MSKTVVLEVSLLVTQQGVEMNMDDFSSCYVQLCPIFLPWILLFYIVTLLVLND